MSDLVTAHRLNIESTQVYDTLQHCFACSVTLSRLTHVAALRTKQTVLIKTINKTWRYKLKLV